MLHITNIVDEKKHSISTFDDSISKSQIFNSEVSDADPLCLDEFMNYLPLLNQSIDTDLLIKSIDEVIPSKEVIKVLNSVDASAALRDLGHIAASLRQKGVNPEQVPKLKEALILLSSMVDEVPRDTVYSYGPRNPRDSRIRKFTTLPEEVLFIESFSEGMKGIDNTIESLTCLEAISITSPDFHKIVEQATEAFSAMGSAILQVMRQIPPEMFTGILRPFFDPIDIDGITYLAPGGAQMPILLIDLILWSSDIDNPEYIAYLEDNLKYCPKVYRDLALKFRSNHTPLLKRVINELSGNEKNSEERENIRLSLESLRNLFSELIKFRRPHLKVAQDNFALRSDCDVGSGGYRTDILQVLVQRTEEAKSIISNILKE